MGRVYRSDKEVTVYVRTEEGHDGPTLPIRTDTAERFPRMARKDRRRMERMIGKLRERQVKKGEGDGKRVDV